VSFIEHYSSEKVNFLSKHFFYKVTNNRDLVTMRGVESGGRHGHLPTPDSHQLRVQFPFRMFLIPRNSEWSFQLVAAGGSSNDDTFLRFAPGITFVIVTRVSVLWSSANTDTILCGSLSFV
jgi:hypothetical protein